MNIKDLAELHLFGIRSLDKEQMRSLLPFLRESELRLRRKLDQLPQTGYSYRRSTQILLRRSILEMERHLMEETERAATESFGRGIQEANFEVLRLNKESTPFIDVKKQEISIKQNRFLINNAQASLRTYTAGVRARISDSITQSILSEETGHTAAVKVSKFIASNIDKGKLIFRTEQHKILNNAKLLAYGEFRNEYFPDLKKALFHPMDKRTGDDSKQLNALGPVVPLDKPFEFVYVRKLADGSVKKVKRVFMTPPDRPNDRATIVPHRSEWRLE